jgi:hypothetical protein
MSRGGKQHPKDNDKDNADNKETSQWHSRGLCLRF